MSRKLYWIIKKIKLYIFVAGLSSKTPTGRENCSLISMILSNFPRNVNYCYCGYQQRQQRRLAIMTSKLSKWNNSLCELSIIIHWEISVNHSWKCNKFPSIHLSVHQSNMRNISTESGDFAMVCHWLCNLVVHLSSFRGSWSLKSFDIKTLTWIFWIDYLESWPCLTKVLDQYLT